jgi:hypothetical protein
MEHLLALKSRQKGSLIYCAFCFDFLFVFHIFCTQKEFHIHAHLEFRRPLILCSIVKIIPENDFIFAIDSSRVFVAFHQTENDSIASYNMYTHCIRTFLTYMYFSQILKRLTYYICQQKAGGTSRFTSDSGNMESLFYNKIKTHYYCSYLVV